MNEINENNELNMSEEELQCLESQKSWHICQNVENENAIVFLVKDVSRYQGSADYYLEEIVKVKLTAFDSWTVTKEKDILLINADKQVLIQITDALTIAEISELIATAETTESARLRKRASVSKTEAGIVYYPNKICPECKQKSVWGSPRGEFCKNTECARNNE